MSTIYGAILSAAGKGFSQMMKAMMALCVCLVIAAITTGVISFRVGYDAGAKHEREVARSSLCLARGGTMYNGNCVTIAPIEVP